MTPTLPIPIVRGESEPTNFVTDRLSGSLPTLARCLNQSPEFSDAGAPSDELDQLEASAALKHAFNALGWPWLPPSKAGSL